MLNLKKMMESKPPVKKPRQQEIYGLPYAIAERAFDTLAACADDPRLSPEAQDTIQQVLSYRGRRVSQQEWFDLQGILGRLLDDPKASAVCAEAANLLLRTAVESGPHRTYFGAFPRQESQKREAVTTAYAAGVKNRFKESEQEVSPMPKVLEEARLRTENLHKQAANYLQRSAAAPRIEKAIREKDETKALSTIMLTLSCDRPVAENILQAYRLL